MEIPLRLTKDFSYANTEKGKESLGVTTSGWIGWEILNTVRVEGMVKKWSNLSENHPEIFIAKSSKFLILLVPEVGIEPTWG